MVTSVKISIWKQNWGNQGPNVHQQPHPARCDLDPHSSFTVCQVIQITGFRPVETCPTDQLAI